MPFPAERPRRLRSTERLRRMVRETRLAAERLICRCSSSRARACGARSLDARRFHLSVDEARRGRARSKGLGIPGVILFGMPEAKDPQGTRGATRDDGIVQRRRARDQARDAASCS